VEPTARFEILEGALQPGDTIVLYTDGVTEAENASQELFGTERARQILSGLEPRGKAADLVVGLEDAVTAFVGEAPQSDDITVLALNFRGG
jgi:sigma-B regulation protein RsbU (phosphoserine phosphatase)